MPVPIQPLGNPINPAQIPHNTDNETQETANQLEGSLAAAEGVTEQTVNQKQVKRTQSEPTAVSHLGIDEFISDEVIVTAIPRQSEQQQPGVDESLIQNRKYEAGERSGFFSLEVSSLPRQKDPKKVSEYLATVAGNESDSPVGFKELTVAAHTAPTQKQVDDLSALARHFGESKEYRSLLSPQIAETFYVAVSHRDDAIKVLDVTRTPLSAPADPVLVAGPATISSTFIGGWSSGVSSEYTGRDGGTVRSWALVFDVAAAT